MADKPPFYVPAMSEIESIEPNGYVGVSTFSGAGGSCLGFRMAGFKMLWASEFVEAAQEVYRLNHPKSYLDTRDIREVTAENLLSQIGLKIGELDILEGSPPCASFSTAGTRTKSWGTVVKYSDKEQRVDDLFFEFSRLLRGLQPKVFVAENVSGLLRGKAKGVFIEIMQELKSCGYEVSAKLLNSKWLGVPQRRERVIFVGVRNDLVERFDVHPAFPKPLPYFYTVKDAAPWIIQICDKGGRYVSSSMPHRTIMQSDALRGDSAQFSATGWVKAKQDNNPLDMRPLEKRKFTIEELKRVQGFPDDFQLTGDFPQQWERLGRAVPPVMMFYIAKTIKEEILDKITERIR